MALLPSIKSRMPDTSVPQIRIQKAPPFKYKFEDEKLIIVSFSVNEDLQFWILNN